MINSRLGKQRLWEKKKVHVLKCLAFADPILPSVSLKDNGMLKMT